MSNWYSVDPLNDIAVSTRVRLARNLKDTPFPSRLNGEQKRKVAEKIKAAILESDTPFARTLKFISMADVPDNEIRAMVERHIISPEFAGKKEGRAVIISEDETVCVMIGEEDHVRIQVILPGLCLDKAYALAQSIDDLLSAKCDFAYDSQLGYLTECPTNLGTGLRASVMLHLPLMESVGAVGEISDTIGKIGFTVRGMYGEGSKSKACLYQISNQITLGITEKNAIDNLNVITKQIIERERAEREKVDRIKLEDIAWRAYGTLKNQRLLSSDEMFRLVSNLKIGISMGILPFEQSLPTRILIETSPYMLCRKEPDKTPMERDILRAKTVRNMIP